MNIVGSSRLYQPISRNADSDMDTLVYFPLVNIFFTFMTH